MSTLEVSTIQQRSGATANVEIRHSSSNKILSANTTAALVVPPTTFSGNITANNITTSSGDLVVDVAGDITLDADGGEIRFKDGGTTFAEFKNDSTYLDIKNPNSNQDIMIKGVDDGSTITAVQFDMSDAGRAIFNAGVSIGGNAAANTLDDYEEGTWTPALRGESGTEPGAASVTSALYVKVGQLVHIECRLVLGTDNGGSGLEMTGLPFITSNAVLFHVSETAVSGVVGVLFSNGQIAAGTGHVTFREGNGTSTWITGTYVQVGSGQYTIVGTYRTTS